MKKTYRYLMLALAGTAILSGCGKKDDDKHADETEASVSTEAADATDTETETETETESRTLQPITPSDYLVKNASDYVTLGSYDGIEIVQYTYDITDEMVQELSQTSKTVDEYKAEIRKQVEESRENSAREEEETRAWEKVIDNSTVKKYPKDRLKHVKDNLKDMYQRYADQAGVSYEEYLKATKVTEKDIDKAAKASLKQELVADVIANYYGLKPTEEEFQEGLQEYVDKYNLTNVDTLLATVSEDDMRTLITEKNVMSWVTDRCRYVKSSDSKDTTDSKSSDSKTSDSKTSDATESSDKESK